MMGALWRATFTSSAPSLFALKVLQFLVLHDGHLLLFCLVLFDCFIT